MFVLLIAGIVWVAKPETEGAGVQGGNVRTMKVENLDSIGRVRDSIDKAMAEDAEKAKVEEAKNKEYEALNSRAELWLMTECRSLFKDPEGVEFEEKTYSNRVGYIWDAKYRVRATNSYMPYRFVIFFV